MVACHFAYLQDKSVMAILIARCGEREHLVLDPFHPFDKIRDGISDGEGNFVNSIKTFI